MSIIKRARWVNGLRECIWVAGWLTLSQAFSLAVVVYFHWRLTWLDVTGVAGLGFLLLTVAVALGVWVIYENGSPPFDRKEAGEVEHASVHYTGAADVVADSVMRQAFREEKKKFQP
jgi:hypothetical protein